MKRFIFHPLKNISKPVQGSIAVALLISSLPACSIMGGASHHQSTDFQKNIYSSVGIGTSRLTPNVDNFPALDVNDRIEPAGQITIGADLTKTFSVEVHSADLGSAGFSPSGGADNSTSAGRYNYHMNGASALAYLGKNKSNNKRRGFNSYGRLGLVSIDNSATNSTLNYERDGSAGVLLGAGIEYGARNGLGMRAEVMATDTDVQFAQVGINYRLGIGSKRLPTLAAAKPVANPIEATSPKIAAARPVPKSAPVRPVRPMARRVISMSEVINFNTDSADLTSGAKVRLDAFAKSLMPYPDISLNLSAHADSTGPKIYNQALSQRRASSVVQYLGEQGIQADIIKTSADGELSPVQANTTAEGRFANRRVELSTISAVRRQIAQ